MGRSGGGGGRSSGGFRGGRSSGGFSGGGRSSGRSYSSGRSFSSGRPYHHHHTSIYYGPWGGGYHTASLWSFIAIMAFMIILLSVFTNNIRNSNSVPKNTTQRTALSGVVNKTDWYEDNIGWVSSRNTLIEGLEDFYNKTGIQPYIILVPYTEEYWTGDVLNATAADQYLQTVYESKFTDEAHFIFAYFQSRVDSRTEMEGEFRYLSGYAADTIMDNEAISILWGFFEQNYYNTSLTMEEMISNTFSETAERIMSRPTNGWDFAKVAIIVMAVVAVIVVIYLIIKNANKRAKEKEEYTKKILNTPLETFGTDTSELEKKYKNTDNKNENN